MTYILHPAADEELAEGVRYYSKIDAKLGIRFYSEMERLIREVCSDHSDLGALIHR